MVRYLSEDNIKQLLTMPIALEQMERGLQAYSTGRAIDVARARIQVPDGIQHVLQAAAPELGLIGFKYYYTRPSGKSFYVHLIDTKTAKLQAIIEAVYQSMVRTGAASGLGARYLGREDATIVGQIGAGYQSTSQLEAVCAVRKIRSARVYSRNREKLQAYCAAMSKKLGIEVSPAESAEACVKGAHIINVITKAADPVLKGAWLEAGQHINAAGSNALSRREIDEETIKRCDVITVDGRRTAEKECGDLLPAVERGLLRWDALTELGEVMAGVKPGRTSASQITLYESHGMGIQDLYVGAKMLELARERNVGIDLPVGA
jgi:ornithine cyclodeaminase